MRRNSRHRRHDIVFYTPWIGSILSRQSLPPGGAETQVLMLARALSRQGLRVGIIVFGDRGELPTEFKGLGIIARRGYKEHPRLIEKLERDHPHLGVALASAFANDRLSTG